MKAGSRTGAVTALAGALALASFTAPAAQAADTGMTVSRIVINGGKPIVVGTTNEQTPPITFRISLPSGYSTAHPGRYGVDLFLYHGTTAAKGAERDALFLGDATCNAVSDRVDDCTGHMRVWPDNLRSNSDATTWKIGALARLYGSNAHINAEEYLTPPGAVQVKRWAKATVNASPEPVTKGKTITVTGNLTRADWATHKYTGVAQGLAHLQFCKKGSSVYTTVKSVRSSSTGALKSTVTASADGYWRWSFGGWDTTGSANSAADYVDVR
ncbi:hypothetical protein [Streptomyces sp. NBC_01336]|uniref:hypothetical protein n=1 Tax=unclassified Streptomyces TaxID=2593676 RepID=UPI002E112B5E|nr:hypothetical protein OG471_06495 [Streptomyces sp. NBC_01336]